MNKNKTVMTYVSMGSFAVPVTFQSPVVACDETEQVEQAAVDTSAVDEVSTVSEI